LYQNRLNDYRRVDVGFQSAETMPLGAKSKLVGNFKELAIGLEIFNLFNNQNAITIHGFEMLIQNEYAIPII
jgi:hypothetical protein